MINQRKRVNNHNDKSSDIPANKVINYQANKYFVMLYCANNLIKQVKYLVIQFTIPYIALRSRLLKIFFLVVEANTKTCSIVNK